jgi:hypothetical protein
MIKDFIENFYKTKIQSIYEDDYVIWYPDSDPRNWIAFLRNRTVYYDRNFVYKVFQKRNDMDQFEKFLKNYRGDLQLISSCKKDDAIIFQFNKLPGETILSNQLIDLDLDELKKWFKNQAIEIHNTGIRCYNKYDEYKIKRDPYGIGFIFCFCDWSHSNLLYDQENNKLHLVDLDPVNWVSRNIWYCIVRDHFRLFIKQFKLKGLDDSSYVAHLVDTVVEELDKEIPLFLD